jgi:biotin carboxyl carrier protein
VVRVLVAAAETIAAGQPCIVIEAMKMQNELKAPKAGVVRRLAAVEGETVAAGAVLLVVE